MNGFLRIQFHACREIVMLLTRHWELTWELAKRELTDRYSGQILGFVWAFVHPLILMGIYIFIFAIVFQQKLGGTREFPLDYPAYLLAGLVPWLGMQESMNKSCTAITSNASLVKQVVFPIEILPVKSVLVSMFTVTLSILVLVIYVLVSNQTVHWTYALLPVLLVIQSLWMIGLAFTLSSIGVYIRDTKDLVQVGSLVSMYLMPIFYLPAVVPDMFRPILYLNPFSYLIWCYQDILYFGRFEHPWAWVMTAILAIGFFGFGYRLFRKLKAGFGNVL